MAGLLAQDKEQVEAGFKALGSVAGGVTAGAIGGVQGGMSPQTFGEGTSSASGAMQGFATNYDNAMNGGGQGGFSSLLGGGGGGQGGGGGGGMNFKQLQQQGKVADQFWKLMADGQPKLDGEDPKALGVTKEQWDTFGARDKWGVVSNAFRQQQMQSAELAYKKGMQDLAATIADRQRETTSLDNFSGAYKGWMAANTAGGEVTPEMQAQAFAAGAEASGDPSLLFRGMQANQRSEAFTPQGGALDVNGWKIPYAKSSAGQAQFFPELSTNEKGAANPRFNREAAGLTARDRLLAAQKTIDRISRIPAARQSPEDKADLEEARRTARELQGGGSGAGGGDDLWQEFLNSKK